MRGVNEGYTVDVAGTFRQTLLECEISRKIFAPHDDDDDNDDVDVVRSVVANSSGRRTH